MAEENSDNLPEPKMEYTEEGLVKGYECPQCGGSVKPHHIDDIGTKFFKCEKCGGQSAKLRSTAMTQLIEQGKVAMRSITVEELTEILASTICHDNRNKVVTFLGMTLTYTEEDQINISFTAESSTGKSYIPLELAWYFPKDDTIEYSYVSPTAFFHEYGLMIPDPSDKREDVEPEKKRKIVIIDLQRKILIFVDQPHDMLLQRLRPLLSHDRKILTIKITDRRERSGLRTKTVLLEGFPTVLFCTAKFNMEDQERTRLLLLSPETHQQKLKAAILLKIEKDSDRDAFYRFMESDPKRQWLQERVRDIAAAHIKNIIVPEELRVTIADRFFQAHTCLIPRHQRDITRLLALIKAHALLNLGSRERIEDNIIVTAEDVEAGFSLYEEISVANELGLPPEVFEIFSAIKGEIPAGGVTRKEFQALYYQAFRRTLGKKRLGEILDLLQSVGLLVEEPDPGDLRQKRILLPTGAGVFNSDKKNDGKEAVEKVEKINTPRGVCNTSAELLHTGPGVFNFEELASRTKTLERLRENFQDKCICCGSQGRMDWQVTDFDGCQGWLCGSCGVKVSERLNRNE